ncbi:MAG: hypothetical protein JWN48_3898, partial [Myxococcaceae bacterium]|nr:hypothetical protein [Myxococcaceae bacterium]
WAVSIKPSVAYFVRDRIGFGLMPGYSTGTQGSLYGDDRFHQGSIEAYGVFDVPLAERLSLLAIPSLGYAFRKERDTVPTFVRVLGSSSVVPSEVETKRHHFQLTVHLPLVFHASSSVVLGLGPYFTYDRGFADTTTVSLDPALLPPGSNAPTRSPFAPYLNSFEVGLASFIGASF